MNEQAAIMNQQQLMNGNQNLMSMNQMNPRPQPQPQMVQMNRSYGMWAQPQQFQNPNLKSGAMKPPPSAFRKSLGPRSNWKGKKATKAHDKRRAEQQNSLMTGSGAGAIGGVNTIGGGAGGGNLKFNNYYPPTLNALQHQNRLKARKFFPKKKFNKNNSMNMNMVGNNSRSAPFAPRNTTSFLIRAKKSGGIAPLVSPYPVTPSVLPTPVLSPSKEVLVDMAKEEWGVDGYGSMKGLIRLRSPGHEDEEEDEGSSSESDVEEHVEVERRLDHDLSRFEMIYNPNSVVGTDHHNVLENRVDDQDTHIAQLEEENLILKEKLFLMERELGDLRRRMLSLERRRNRGEEMNEEVVENESENESASHEDVHLVEDNNEDFNIENIHGDRSIEGKDNLGPSAEGFEAAATMERSVELVIEAKVDLQDKGVNSVDKNINITDAGGKEGINKDIDELLMATKRSEENTANMDENKCVTAGVEVKSNIDVESCQHVMVGNACMSEDGVAKDSTDSKNDAAN